ncbi:MAG: hypothetical protein ICV54_19615 [Nostoc sp. C3-bin3]|nr:hypothetical protein [Nostoc sp. C3-bin3]
MQPNPDALAYAVLIRHFLWSAAAPTLLSIIVSMCCIKVIRGVFDGL